MDAIREAQTADSGESLDVLVMGTLLAELVPQGASPALVDMTHLLPTASGAAANFALALAALGPRVGLLSRVGDDELGQWVKRQLERAGVDVTEIEAVPGQLTPLSLAWADLRGGKCFSFYRFPGCSDPLATLSPTAITPAGVRRARVFDFTEGVVRSEGLRATAFQAARWCRETGGRVVYAVNYRPQAWRLPWDEMAAVQRAAIALADVALMNEDEYALLFAQAGAELPADWPGLLLVTAGERGGWWQQAGARESWTPRAVTVRYDVGAGDTFHAGYVAAYLQGLPPAEAARFAAGCAALKISQPPSAPPPTREQVEAFLRPNC
jgi:sugar/nucleoside kinase (ribokinase family)